MKKMIVRVKATVDIPGKIPVTGAGGPRRASIVMSIEAFGAVCDENE